MRKYHNKKVKVYGIEFDSKKEAARYLVLRDEQKRGLITDLRLQVPFVLIPSQKRDDGKTERPCKYVADFVYTRNGKTIVEDTKGFKTGEYIIKRKLMLLIHGITVQEL